MMACGVCGEEHAPRANCIVVLKRIIADLRAIGAQPAPLESNYQPVLSNAKSNGFDKRAYQREYMRKRRMGAEHD